jgi:hypothetical protein
MLSQRGIFSHEQHLVARLTQRPTYVFLLTCGLLKILLLCQVYYADQWVIQGTGWSRVRTRLF